MRPGACSGGVAPDCCRRPTRCYPQGSLSPSWAPPPPDLWRPPSSSSPHQGRVAFLLLLIVIFGGRGVSLVFRHHVRSALAVGATPAPLGLLLGLLLRRLIGRRDQHLRQERALLEFAYLPSAYSLPSAGGRQRRSLPSACKKRTAKNWLMAKNVFAIT